MFSCPSSPGRSLYSSWRCWGVGEAERICCDVRKLSPASKGLMLPLSPMPPRLLLPLVDGGNPELEKKSSLRNDSPSPDVEPLPVPEKTLSDSSNMSSRLVPLLCVGVARYTALPTPRAEGLWQLCVCCSVNEQQQQQQQQQPKKKRKRWRETKSQRTNFPPKRIQKDHNRAVLFCLCTCVRPQQQTTKGKHSTMHTQGHSAASTNKLYTEEKNWRQQ